VRVPAAWNDLVGLKTSVGRLPTAGVLPLAERFDTVGPLTRNVEDAALLLAALGGERPADLAGATLAGVRLMALQTVAQEGVREGPAQGFAAAVARLEAAGAKVEPAEVPAVAAAIELSGVLFATEAYATWGEAIEADPDAMFPPVRERFRGGRAFSGVEYVRAWQQLERLRAEWAAASAGYDAVILPTAALTPPKIAALEADEAFFAAENLLTLRNTRIGNLMGLCALTLPTGTPSAGLMLMAPPGAEARLLRLGAAAEAALA
jgi:aspartyl-tRNA(Asn)/glutamyl-tRNA(Gln) amidotransferase subunit A